MPLCAGGRGGAAGNLLWEDVYLQNGYSGTGNPIGREERLLWFLPRPEEPGMGPEL